MKIAVVDNEREAKLLAVLNRVSLENKEFREAIEKALSIIDRNLYHQREKCEDAVIILQRALQEN